MKTGKVKFTFQHMAFLSPESEWAAEASECASEQGKFWEYHDKLYDNQGRGAFAKDKLKGYAAELKLDQQKFNACLDTDKYLDQVRAETAKSEQMGVSSTPTIFINDKKIVGALPYEEFEKAINQALGK